MELKEEYKQTEIGLLPNEWDAIKLGDILSFKNGLNKESEFFGYGTPIVNYMDVFSNYGITKDQIQGLVAVNSQEIQSFSTRKGDVFFTRTSETVDEIGISTVLLEDVEKCVFSGFILRGRNKKDLLDIEFKKFCFSSSIVRNQIVSTSSYTTRALTNGRLLSAIYVPVPKESKEQQAIATALGEVDTLITNLDKLITKKKAIKQGAMQQLLKSPKQGGKRLPGFEGDWVEKEIGSFARVVAGGTPSTLIPEYWNGDIPWMNSGELNLKFVSNVENRITEEGLNNSSTQKIPARSVLIGLAGQGKTRGTAAFNFIELCTNQSIAAIFPNPKYDSLFLYYFMDMQYHELRKLSTGDGGRGGLNLTIIKKVKTPFPTDIKEQKAIATILSDMNKDLESLEQKKLKYTLIKQGMMQELLTGKTRLV